MNRRRIAVIAGISIFLACLEGCAGQAGPVGPAGPAGQAGPGSQTSYTATLTPSARDQEWTIVCPAVNLDATPSTSVSTVTCIVTRSNYNVWYDLPVTLNDTASGGSTYYRFYLCQGAVVVRATTSNGNGTDLAATFNVAITVVNP